LPFGDGGEEDAGVRTGVGPGIGPHEPRRPVGQGDSGGEPFGFGGDDAGGEKGFADDCGPISLVLGQPLPGPLAGDQDPAAT